MIKPWIDVTRASPMSAIASVIFITIGCTIPRYPQAIAQVIPDGTLSTTVRSSDNRNFVVEGGDLCCSQTGGGNGLHLFHSFEEFSVPRGGEVQFNNAAAITHIFSRVTGGTPSHIRGTLSANHSANLFLINPAGILFSKDASLNIGGSFLATTAESLVFEDGLEFSATQPNEASLLTINGPIGLQMGRQSEDIVVKGPGYTVATENPFIVTSEDGLSVPAGKTLALIGNPVALDGGLLTVESGLIELASVSDGMVQLNLGAADWQFNYDAVDHFNDISLLSLALVNGSGPGGGHIYARGQNISLEGGARFFQQTQGEQSGGRIQLTASEAVEITGTDGETGELGSVVQTETIGNGDSSEIVISSKRLLLALGAGISGRTFSAAGSGDITINATESIQLTDFSPIDPTNGSDISNNSFVDGKAGNVNIVTPSLTIDGQQLFSVALGNGDGGTVNLWTDRLRVTNGGVIGSSVQGSGQGGDLNIKAQSVELIGINTDNFTASALTTSTIGTGQAGNLTINTRELRLEDGGRVDASSFLSGLAGNITIKASSSIEVKGRVPGSVNPSLIISGANILDEELQQMIGLPRIPEGESGSILIHAPSLTITDGAQVTVRNDGPGDAGILHINADQIVLEEDAGITASTQSGQGGDIQLKTFRLTLDQSQIAANSFQLGGRGGNIDITADGALTLVDSEIISTTASGDGGNLNVKVGSVLSLQEGSTLSTTAGQIGAGGNGGNIRITSPFVVGVATENSDIAANAFTGNGGNIMISTQGIFGLTFRDRLTPNSDITASSEFGINGTVAINNPEADPNSRVLELPDTFVAVSELARSGCSLDDARLVVTGRGGLPFNPTGLTSGDRPWFDLRDPLSLSNRAIPDISSTRPYPTFITSASTPSPQSTSIQEATGIAIAANGQQHLINAQPQTVAIHSTTCPS